ncbi:type II/IV secretion system protein [Clostridiaceae bacterium UIB06]|uniref:Type II/IV secretion system protein n=1 Tax=Clostridium thailandense TaxID=2794346 RepID=A0A949U085_9CLOT|nr:GspE/PulE family protein [Clostridium thailandense]MBV7275041.1 type II/IV secretion system protein [Clostridium thailandense]MCH5136555.1 type II/IV secretion system protein [Clostridiaceae bacterium UIB06]
MNKDMPIIDLENTQIDNKVVQKIPEKIANDNCLIAFKEFNDYTYIAVERSPNVSLEEELRFIIGKNIRFFYAHKAQIVNCINSYYCKYSVESAIKNIETQNTDNFSQQYSKILNEEKLKEAPVVKIVNSILNGAIHQNASDIHLEPFEDETLVRFRVDGIMSYFMSVPHNIYSLVCTRFKIMALMDISERRIPQDGKIKYAYENIEYDLRVSTLPTVYGEKIVIRILYKSIEMKLLDTLGFGEKAVKSIKSMLENRYGIILVTGPTGSGKTTTLYSMLNSLNKKEKNITSIEDPVEYSVKNVNQVNVNSKIGFSFAEGLRSILRQDPDVIMLGEIRDEETAQIAIRAAITGHLVISTLHTNDAAESILRLEDMGIPDYFLEEALKCIISQRLVRRICPYCKKPYYASNSESKSLNLPMNYNLYKGTGCWQCNYTGYKGRIVVYEIMDLNRLKNINIKSQKSIEDIRKVNMDKGMVSMKDHCTELVKNGVTTYEEFMRINL